nr:hypothetical protein [Tanacetum cinerariifolium]
GEGQGIRNSLAAARQRGREAVGVGRAALHLRIVVAGGRGGQREAEAAGAAGEGVARDVGRHEGGEGERIAAVGGRAGQPQRYHCVRRRGVAA